MSWPVDVVSLDQQVQNGRCCMRLLLLCCWTASIALYHTHMGVMPGVVVCLASALPLACGKSEDRLLRYSIPLQNKHELSSMYELSSTLVHSPSHSAPHPNHPGHPFVPSSQRLVSNLRSRLAATAAEQVPLVDDSLVADPGRFTSKLKRSYPGPWLASSTAGVSMSCTGCVANLLYFLVILYGAVVRPGVLGGEHDSRH